MLFVRRSSVSGLLIALVGAAGFIACCIHEEIAGTDTPIGNILYGVFAALVLCGCMLQEQRGKLAVPRMLKSVGDASYSIYLVHPMALSLIAKIVAPALRHFRVPLVIPFVVMAIAAVVIGVAVHYFVEKPVLLLLSKRKTVFIQKANSNRS